MWNGPTLNRGTVVGPESCYTPKPLACLLVFASELYFMGSNQGCQFLQSKKSHHFLMYLRREGLCSQCTKRWLGVQARWHWGHNKWQILSRNTGTAASLRTWKDREEWKGRSSVMKLFLDVPQPSWVEITRETCKTQVIQPDHLRTWNPLFSENRLPNRTSFHWPLVF